MNITKAIVSAVALFSLSVSSVHAGDMGAKPSAATGDIYLAIFGGAGGADNVTLKQKSTFFMNDANRPIAVDARGKSGYDSAWLIGGHVGYQWLPRTINHLDAKWTVAPATELEGYYLNSTLKGSKIDNETIRLVDHEFISTYPMDIGVFLINAVFNFNYADKENLHLYIGAGIGTAITSVSRATSIQTIPVDPIDGINHYNSDPNDSGITFAAQPKVGLAFNLNETTNLFIEYRLLYTAIGKYIFGSTVNQLHHVSSPWDVSIGSHFYNLGTVGIQYDL
jgi:hypothetical protein